MSDTNRLMIGRIVRAQGLKGEVKVQPLTDVPQQLGAVEAVYVGRDAAPRKVISARFNQGFGYLQLEGVEDRTAAEKLHGAELWADRAELGELEADTFYIADLIGCRVVTDEGETLGSVADVLQAGGNDVYEIRGEKTGYIPARKVVIASVDIQTRLITVYARALPEVAVFED